MYMPPVSSALSFSILISITNVIGKVTKENKIKQKIEDKTKPEHQNKETKLKQTKLISKKTKQQQLISRLFSAAINVWFYS